MKRTLAVLLAVVMTAALAFPLLAFASGGPSVKTSSGVAENAVVSANDNIPEIKNEPPRDPSEIVTIIVKLGDEPVLARASLDDTRSAELTAELKAKQTAVMDEISEKLLGKAPLELKFRYTLLFNGFAFRGEYRLIDEIKKLDGVKNCYESWSYELPEDIKPGEGEKLATSVGWINADDLWALGYTGQGQTIAVIDTGIKVSHPNFAAAPENPHFNAAAIQTILNRNDLCAEELYNGTLTGTALYNSAKIPYTFNYVTGTTDVSHATAGSDHGTHVSSICAGNDSSARGVAYNAQILSMQVFEGSGGEWATILAALEDCAYLRVDALNMSLGADCGFTHDEDMDPTFELLTAAGVNCAVASGNSGYAGSGSLFNGTNPTFNFDTGVTSSPGSAVAALSVAASEDSSSHALASYSSWGTTSDLRIKPEIMAPGSNINAATDSSYSGGNYGTKSGTSMATPHIAGSMALVNQYVNANFPDLSETAKMQMVNTLLMSTAVPASQSSTYYSPRAQGAGQADLAAAVTTKAYIEVPGCVRPKIELGDDDEKTGVFTLTFDVVNFGNTALTFNVVPTVLTEGTSQWLIGSQLAYVMSHSEENITSLVNVTGGGNISVPANGRRTVTVTIDVNPYAAALNEQYPLGAYIEGYIRLDGAVDIGLPFLGFYGDWEYSAVFDRKCYFDSYLGITHDYPNQWGTNVAASSANGSSVYLGKNPFADSVNFSLDRSSISPNGDGFMDSISTVYTYMLRNAEIFRYEVLDAETDEQYYVQDVMFVPKAVENSWFSYYQPVGAEDWTRMEPFTGEDLADGTTVILRMTGFMQSWDEFDPADNEFASWEVPVTIDRQAPEVVWWSLHNGELNVFVQDNHYSAFVGVYSNAACTNLIASEAIEEDSRGALSMLTFDVGSRQTVYLKVGDYAYNTAVVTVTEGESGEVDPVDLTGIQLSAESVTVYEGYTSELRLIREPANSNNFDTVWSSDNQDVATVSGGLLKATVTGVHQGQTTVRATVTDRRTGRSFTASAAVTVNDYPTFDEAANAAGSSIHFYNGGTYPWAIDMPDGRACVKSTNEGVNSSTSAFTTETLSLAAGDKLEFWWMVSSETNYDKLKFYVNNSETSVIHGGVGWTRYEYTVPSAGSYTFRWSYEKDGSVATGEDTGRVDDIRIIYVAPPYTLGDVDNDGDITVADALLALRHAMGLFVLEGTALSAADVDLNGSVELADALLILRRAMGLSSGF